MAAKRWKTVTLPHGTVQIHASEAEAYEVVYNAREIWRSGSGPSTPIGVTVYEYDPAGDRWQVFDRHNFGAGT